MDFVSLDTGAKLTCGGPNTKYKLLVNRYFFVCVLFRICSPLDVTGFLEEPEHAARGRVGDGGLALHLVLPRRVPCGDLVFGLHQNQSGLVQQLKDLLRLPLAQLPAELQV